MTALTAADDPVHRALGLTDDEAASIASILDRTPNHLELAMYSVMWSEHCSYKSSRLHLRRLPTDAPWVLVGPGENAGVVDVGDGIAIAIRIESHNHPSAIEPYQGAATGVGGILRDIFTMGARPIALLDPLRFGPLEDPRSRWIAEGVVSGISGYGNAVGVPTVGGETVFDPTYADNPLVNVLCLGVLPSDRVVLGRATGAGNRAVLLGSATGRDGIGGVSVLASAGFTSGDAEAEAAKRPSVQVGDPFEEKRLIEACLELIATGLVVGIQDLGGAGLTCATSETASRGGMGMDVHLAEVPCREPGMEPFEVMTSESQERMLAIVEPDDLDDALAICARWEVSATAVGTVTDTGRLRVLDRRDGDVLADVPASSLHDDAPLYDRPRRPPADLEERRSASPSPDDAEDASGDLLDLLADSRWVYSQYDHQLFLNTVIGPGADATVLRLKHPLSGDETGRGIALTTDGNHRWCSLDPRAGTVAVVAEAVLNLACVGARPLALVNCLNFGNPEHTQVMWQLSEAIDGLAEACRGLGLPVVGGNVSLYNESGGADIDPTPVVGVVGVIDRLAVVPPGPVLVDGDAVLLLGPASVDLGGSVWAWRRGHRGGSLTPPNIPVHLQVCALVRDLVNRRVADAVHDVSEGGLAVALAEMAAAGGVGVRVGRDAVPDMTALFGEGPSRAVVCVAPDRVPEVRAECAVGGVTVTELGTAGNDRFVVGELVDLDLAQVMAAWRDRLPAALGLGTTQGLRGAAHVVAEPARLSAVDDESEVAAPGTRPDLDVAGIHARLDDLFVRLDRLEQERATQAAEIGSSLTYVHVELEKLRRELAKSNLDHAVLDDAERSAIADAVLDRINEAFELTAESDADAQT